MAETVINGEGRTPRLKAPELACECHSHIYAPAGRYAEASGGTPHGPASLEAYETMLARLGISRGVIVQPSLYGSDNGATLEAIATMGLNRARGVAIAPEADEAELKALHDAGIRGSRFFLLAGPGFDVIDEVARRIAPFGWHVDVQDDGDWLGEAIPILEQLPVDVVIDHIGRQPEGTTPDAPGFQALLRFMETGRCWMKISGPYYRSTAGAPGFADKIPLVRAMLECRPDRLVWAANWPHPGFKVDAKPEDADCLDFLLDAVPEDALRNAILADNPARLYDFPN